MITIHPTTAHITSWKTTHFSEVLYVSPLTKFPPEKAIRGGVPICWPNFAAAEGLPFHGFARMSQWELLEDLNVGPLNIKTFELPLETIESGWGQKAKLSFTVSSSENTLEMELITTNLEQGPISFTQALHTYFRVGNIHQVEIEGHDGNEYYDKVADKNKKQSGKITFAGETDRIYLTKDPSILRDYNLNRKIVVSKSGANSTVIWDPWERNAKSMNDMADDDYLNFCCIEAANTHLNPISLPPGESHSLVQKIELIRM